jgi:S1-C subfamily serine protease
MAHLWRRSALAAGLGLTVLVGWTVPSGADRVLTVQEALLRAKPAVALVIAEVAAEVSLNCGSGEIRVTPPPFRETGTGWFIDPRGLLITNGHVVQPAHTPPRWLINSFARRAIESACVPAMLRKMGITPGERADAEDQVKRRALDSILPTTKVKLGPGIFVVLSNGTRVRAEVKKYSPPLSVGATGEGQMSARDLALLKIPGKDYPVLPLADSKATKIGDPIHILGFPGVVLSHELLNQSSTVEASVTNGAVSGFKQDIANQPVIQTDASAAWGNSGGPAVNTRGEVVGVLTFVSPAPGPEGGIVQGFNFVIPSNAARDFVQGTEVKLNAESPFNKVWWAGLQEQFDGNFRRAEARFNEANKFVPNLPDVKRMLAEAQDKIKNPPPQPFPWAWITLGVTLLSLGSYGAMWGRRWWRNRYRVAPSVVIRLLEEGKKPLILDVRKPSAFETSPLKIPGALYVSPEDLDAGKFDLEVEAARTVIAYCT